MIAFASLFLGLFFGVKPVEVVVGQGVATVELRLDGESLGTLRGAPWVKDCDFGTELAPRHLEAVAFDAEGRELGRVSQWLNLPQEAAVASVVLEPAGDDSPAPLRGDGKPRVARVSWESLAGAEPKSVSASLDGSPLAVSDPRRIELPAVDESQLHLLHVELEFEDHVASRVDLTFGGAYADEVSTEITALAIQATGKPRRPPNAGEAQGWFTKAGEPLEVITIEKGTAEIVVVGGRAFPRFVAPGEAYKPPKSLRLAVDQRLRFLSTVPQQTEGVATTFNLFPTSPAYDGALGDLYQLLTGVSFKSRDEPPRLNSAVAVAGLAAFRGRNRRAVVIVPSEKPRGRRLPDPGPGPALPPAPLGAALRLEPRIRLRPPSRRLGRGAQGRLPQSSRRRLRRAHRAARSAVDRVARRPSLAPGDRAVFRGRGLRAAAVADAVIVPRTRPSNRERVRNLAGSLRSIEHRGPRMSQRYEGRGSRLGFASVAIP